MKVAIVSIAFVLGAFGMACEDNAASSADPAELKAEAEASAQERINEGNVEAEAEALAAEIEAELGE